MCCPFIDILYAELEAADILDCSMQIHQPTAISPRNLITECHQFSKISFSFSVPFNSTQPEPSSSVALLLVSNALAHVGKRINPIPSGSKRYTYSEHT